MNEPVLRVAVVRLGQLRAGLERFGGFTRGLQRFDSKQGARVERITARSQ